MAVVSTPSCADNHESIFIFGVVAVTAPDCTAKGDSGSKLLAYGEMELKITDTYGNFLLVGNQLISRGSPTNLRAEPNRVQITGADIQLTGIDGKDFGFYSVPANGLVSPTVSADPTYAPVFVQIIPPAKGKELQKYLAPTATNASPSLTVLADIVIYGQTLGLNDVKTGKFTFTINVTNGGTIVETYNAVKGKIDCTSVPTTQNFILSCFPGQDVSANPCYYVCPVDPTATGCTP